MSIYKLTNDAGDIIPEYRGSSHAQLFEVLLEHTASPSILHDLKVQFEDFLQHSHHTAMLSDVPASLQELRDVGEWLLCCVLLLYMGGVGTRAQKRHRNASTADQRPGPRRVR